MAIVPELFCWLDHGLILRAVARCRLLGPFDSPVLILAERRLLHLPRFSDLAWNALSEEELDRRCKIKTVADQERFVLGRVLLRLFLGAWLDCEPGDVSLSISSSGKPYCSHGPEFNISHSGDLILLGLHAIRPVGVDVEFLQTGLDWYPIAQRFWPAEVVRELCGLPVRSQHAAFVQYWCEFEAAAKACGRGIMELSSADVCCLDCLIWRLQLPGSYCGSAAIFKPDISTT